MESVHSHAEHSQHHRDSISSHLVSPSHLLFGGALLTSIVQRVECKNSRGSESDSRCFVHANARSSFSSSSSRTITDDAAQVEKYGTLEFSRFADLLDVGFDAASTFIAGWEKEGKLPNGMEGNVSAPMRKRGQSMRRNSI